MISNTLMKTGLSSDRFDASTEGQFNPTINLTAESTLATAATFNFQGKLNSNGKKLRIWIANGQTLVWNPDDKTADTADIEVVAGGYLRTFSHGPVKTKNSSLTMTAGGLYVGGVFEVSNYLAASSAASYKYDSRQASNEAVAYLKVYGTFTPQTDAFFACSLQDGSAIDLSGKTTTWSTGTRAKAERVTDSYTGTKGDVDFAANATVTIDVSGRELSDDMRIVEWAATPTNLDGLTFKLDEVSKAAGYGIKKDDEGLFVEVDTGSALTMADVKKALPEGVVLNGETIVFTGKTADEINNIMNTSADNGLTVSANLILGIEQEKNGKFEKKPFLKADAGAQTKEDTITFSFGGIDPKFDKADIKYSIDSATSVGGDADGEGWTNLMSEQPFTDKGATVTVDLPKQGEPAVKYYRVKFTVSEKAVSGDPANQ